MSDPVLLAIHHATDAIFDFLLQLGRQLDAEVTPMVKEEGNWEGAQAAMARDVLPRLTSFLDEHYAAIEAHHDRLSPTQQSAARAYHRLKVQPFFLGSPFVRWSVDKPMGYPGDFKIVEMLFDNQPAGLTPLARLLSIYTLNCGPTRAHRARLAWVHEKLFPLTQAAESPLDVLSFACGPERVMREFYANGGTCNLVLSDFDRRAYEYAEKKIDEVLKVSNVPQRVRCIELSVYRMVKDTTSLERLAAFATKGKFDVITVLGLLDYLQDRSLSRFLDMMASLMKPGGKIFLTNLHRVNPWRCFMDYVGHWELIHRSKAEFEALAVGDDRLRCIEHVTDESGTNLFFLGERM